MRVVGRQRWSRLGAVGAVVLALAGTGLVATGGSGETPQDAAAARVIAAARSHLDETYKWGAVGPKEWDCSGLTSVLWTSVGGAKGMPRVSRDQQAWAWPLRASQRRPGDLVFFGEPVTHVGIYVGGNQIIDASLSNGKVLQRSIWTSDVLRYGRVPRAGISKPTPPDRPIAPELSLPNLLKGRKLGVVPPVGRADPVAMSKTTKRFVTAARKVVGRSWAKGGHGPAYDDAGLVRWAWASAGHRQLLPRTPRLIEMRTTPVTLAQLRAGDLVFYGDPAVHVGIYIGNGFMVDASKAVRKVLLRPVFLSDTVRFGRLKPSR